MKVQVTVIQPSSINQHSKFDPEREISTFDVFVLIGTEQHSFTLAVDLDLISNRPIQIVNTDAHFEKTFKYNLKLNQDISHLVSQIYNHQLVELPADLGEFEIETIETCPPMAIELPYLPKATRTEVPNRLN